MAISLSGTLEQRHTGRERETRECVLCGGAVCLRAAVVTLL